MKPKFFNRNSLTEILPIVKYLAPVGVGGKGKGPEMPSASGPSAQLPSAGDTVSVSATTVGVDISVPSMGVVGNVPEVSAGPSTEEVGVSVPSGDQGGKTADLSAPCVDAKGETELPDAPSADVKTPKKDLLGRFGLGKGKTEVSDDHLFAAITSASSRLPLR